MATEYSHLFYYSEDGNSDKEYIVFLEDNEDGTFDVYALYGRRGSATNRTDKVTKGQEYYARREYNDLIREKVKKGYRVFSAPKVPTKTKSTVNTSHLGVIQEATPRHRKITL